MIDDFYHSAELRWFLPEQSQRDRHLELVHAPGSLCLSTRKASMTRKPPPGLRQAGTRAHRRVLAPAPVRTVGVKQRQGKLEVKALVAGPRPFSLGGVVGRVDQWVKWSFDPSDAITFSWRSS